MRLFFVDVKSRLTEWGLVWGILCRGVGGGVRGVGVSGCGWGLVGEGATGRGNARVEFLGQLVGVNLLLARRLRVAPVHNTCFGQLSCGNPSKARISQQPHIHADTYHTHAHSYHTHTRARTNAYRNSQTRTSTTHTTINTFLCLRSHISCESTCISLSFSLPLTLLSCEKDVRVDNKVKHNTQ